MRKIFLFALLMIFSCATLAKNCKKGIPCGNSCISASKTCHIGSSYNSYKYNSSSSTQSGKTALVYYSVNGNDVNVYTTANIKSKVKYILNKGDQVQVISTLDMWYEISSKKGNGFILKQNRDGYNVINK